MAVLLIAALAGCSAAPPVTRAGFESSDASDLPASGPAPMAELPAAAGAVVAVLQSDAHDTLTQRIVLKGDPDTVGENAIVVKVNETRGPWDIDGPVGLPTKAMIGAELDQDFAGVDMQLANTFERNSFGPFGYAVGHPTPRVTCVYAWEFGVFRWSKLGEAPAGAPSMPLRPTSVRVRLCRSTLGEAEILPMLRALRVFPPGSRTAYFDPNYTGGEAAGDALAAADVKYFLVPGAAPALKRVELAPKPRHRKVAHRVRHLVRTADIEERAAAVDPPAADAVNVPMPAGPSAPTSNPLLAPLATAPHAFADDMPLPNRVAPEERPSSSAPKSAFVPLPN
jgi:hypothetical protein